MQYVYVVIDRTKGFIYGVYETRDDAEKVFAALGEIPGLCLSQEPLLKQPARYNP